MTPADLAALSALEAKATPGSWEIDLDFKLDPLLLRGPDGGGCVAEMWKEHDAEFVVALRNAAPSLLAHVAAQAERIEALEGALKAIQGTPCDESVHAACCGRKHRDIARRVLGGKEGT